MTERIRDDQLDREIRDFLAWQAEDIVDAPTSTEMAIRIGARVGTRPVELRLTPRLALVVLTVMLVIALVGIAAAGGLLKERPPVPRTVVSNGWIAYSTGGQLPGSSDTVSGSDVYLVREGGKPRLIAGRVRGSTRNVCPAFSPDGTKLDFRVLTGTANNA